MVCTRFTNEKLFCLPDGPAYGHPTPCCPPAHQNDSTATAIAVAVQPIPNPARVNPARVCEAGNPTRFAFLCPPDFLLADGFLAVAPIWAEI